MVIIIHTSPILSVRLENLVSLFILILNFSFEAKLEIYRNKIIRPPTKIKNKIRAIQGFELSKNNKIEIVTDWIKIKAIILTGWTIKIIKIFKIEIIKITNLIQRVV